MQKFIPLKIHDKTIFINTDLVQRVYQLDDDVVVEMSNHQEYIIPNTNIQVFMDRFKQ